ncbi:tyrosine-type recombinase/integrase, partial [Mycobacterium tuberculosis]|uniref:tyrosine-type recombinase/integrase n=1 Tax=Mycobacterium tuberculosis TaxID=1773 RepID=UPI000A0D4BB9
MKRGDSWSVQVTVGRRPDGKLDRRRVTGHTPEEAMQKARELQVAAAQGMLATHERLTVGEWMKTWVEAKATRAAPTYRLKLEAHAKHITQHLGSMELRKLRPGHVHTFARALEAKELAPSYRREVLSTLEAAPVTRKVKAWDAATVARFLEVARPYRLYPLFYLGFATGLRREELLGLAWQHVDLEARTLRVEQTLTPDKGGVHIGPPKTRNSRRVVGFGPDVAAVLEGWKAELAEERRILGREWHDSGLVFPSSTGHPLHPRNVNRISHRAEKTWHSAGMSRSPQTNTASRLLDVAALRNEFALGRETSYALLRMLPHVKAGSRYLIRREDLERYLEQAAREGRDIRKEALAAARAAKTPAGAGGAK